MSRVGLGCARLGSAAPGYGWGRSVRLVQAALDAGVTYFDTADAYGSGTSEQVLGAALRGHRGEVTLATKGGYRFAERSALESRARTSIAAFARRARSLVPRPRRDAEDDDGSSGSGYSVQDFSTDYLTSALEGSLRRLRTDHVDVYQLHGPRQADPDAIGEWAAAMIAAGKFGQLGIGAEGLDQARTWLGSSAVSSLQVPFGLLDPEAGRDVIPEAHRRGWAVVARGVLGAGLLTDPGSAGATNAHKVPLIEALRTLAAAEGTDIAELAVSFVARRADVDIIVVGTASPEHVAQVARFAAQPVGGDAMWAAVAELMERHTWA